MPKQILDQPVSESAPSEPPTIEPQKTDTKPYTKQQWKGDVFVFQCTQCTACLTSEDDMILHVVSHRPAAERNKVLDELVARSTPNKRSVTT